MPSLNPTLRKSLENKIPAVRQIAEEAARAVLNTLAINRLEPFPGMTPELRKLRNALRAKARQLGEGSQTTGFEPLVEELAYQQWHRMVFARFLAENQLLMHPTGVSVTLQECGELAQEEGEVDAWAVASKYATIMLPGIFRPNDPESQVRLTPEGQQKLEMALNDIEQPVFLADDALGWMYQFWQKLKKDEINRSERKIGGADLSPVTQLFTEDYMVSFLLENSLGAWWATRHPSSPLIKGWRYLRFNDDGKPAAGSFPGWPELASQVTMMDPCFGSGHILVAGFYMLASMRMEEQGLNAAESGEAVLRDNLFGLELDPRCTQIGAFALTLAAWKSGGYRILPVPNLACSGIPVQGQLETWLVLAEEDTRVRAGLERLYNLFKDAPTLGSLINPTNLPAADRMFVADYEQISPVLEQALDKEHNLDNSISEMFGVVANSVGKAAKLLLGKYTLTITNVPYLARGKQDEVLQDFCKEYHPLAKTDLATVFVERCLDFCNLMGTIAVVTPQGWLYQPTYKKFREFMLSNSYWDFVTPLGVRAFETITGEVVNIVLLVISSNKPKSQKKIASLDASFNDSPSSKAKFLEEGEVIWISQQNQLHNPDARIILGDSLKGELLQKIAASYQGIKTGDDGRFKRNFWELSYLGENWRFYQSTINQTTYFGGMENVIDWRENGKNLARLQGLKAWGKPGIAVSQMTGLPVSLYTGEIFDSNISPIIPHKQEMLKALWAFCSSKEYKVAVKQIDKSLKVTNSALIQIPFDIERWQKVANETAPIPLPFSNNPTQWLFNGHPRSSTAPLHVAVARLLGYHWPQQVSDLLDDLADEDGIVCLVPVAGEPLLAERLRKILAAAYSSEWSPRLQAELLSTAGMAGKSLEDWLRDDFFANHCRLFQNRPFLWQIWDGRIDGFSALVNYHKLNAARLDKLIYTYLGDWIRFQRARRDHGEPGADGRLVAALELEKKLKLIKDGEPPYDIYVRWKPLAHQPIGWDPDLNDGVRLNIRPFVNAGVLRSKFTINWNQDRGSDLDGSERLNDKHFSIAEKMEARRISGTHR